MSVAPLLLQIDQIEVAYHRVITALQGVSVEVNAGTIEFPVDVAPNAVQTISYSVEYTW